MATKTQAKAAIDAAVVVAKARIDNILPTGVNITNGQISFAPLTLSISMDAGGVPATADSWLTTISANLTTAGTTFTIKRSGRRNDDVVKNIIITANDAVVYFITNTG